MGKKISKILKGEIVSSAFYILLGLCLLLIPVQSVNIICKVVFGLVLIGAGVYHIYIYLQGKENCTILDLFTGVIVLVLGVFLFFNPQIVVKLLPLLLGAFVLVDSIWTIRGSFRLKKRNRTEWKAFFIGSLVSVGLGITMMINPFAGIRNTVVFAGAVFLINGLADFIFYFLLKRGMKDGENVQKKEKKKDVKEPKSKPQAESGQEPEAAAEEDSGTEPEIKLEEAPVSRTEAGTEAEIEAEPEPETEPEPEAEDESEVLPEIEFREEAVVPPASEINPEIDPEVRFSQSLTEGEEEELEEWKD